MENQLWKRWYRMAINLVPTSYQTASQVVLSYHTRDASITLIQGFVLKCEHG
jgi:hypothetical protein